MKLTKHLFAAVKARIHRKRTLHPHCILAEQPLEILHEIIRHLNPVDLACLALTSKGFYSVVLQHLRQPILKFICAQPPRPEPRHGYMTIQPWKPEEPGSTFAHLMNRLWHWMGPDYVWCGCDVRKKTYILRQNRHDWISDCGCALSEYSRRRDYVRGLPEDIKLKKRLVAMEWAEEAGMEIDAKIRQWREERKRDNVKRVSKERFVEMTAYW